MIIKKVFTIILIIIINISIISFFNSNILNLPPMGNFLDPFQGYLQLANSDQLPKKNLIFDELNDSVTVIWDDLRIPHIFAKNEYDLYFTQGYVMAKDRLWQMEFQTIVSEGRLSEILGKDVLKYDKFHRRMGLKYGAKNSLNQIQNDTVIYKMLSAFSDGINKYIGELNDKNKPLEYKILDYYPEKWSPFKTILILKYMAWTLSGKSSDLAYSKLLHEHGIDFINELFPLIPYNVNPIFPKNTDFKLEDVKLPQSPNSLYISNPFQSKLLYEPEIGFSNNWVVSSKKSENKKPMLATDPHLSLTLPAIWYAMHLNDTKQNVMGVSIPGAPGIIIGFNDYIAWAETNGYDDVMDWYDIYFKDSTMNEYYYDNSWHKTNKIIETYFIKNQRPIKDTITYTHHGPIVWDYNYQTETLGSKTPKGKRPRQISMGRALKWQAHDASNEVKTFYQLNHAKNYTDFVIALESFVCPGQNFAYIDEENIAMWHAGSPPIKWQGQGKFIGDGRDPIYDWNKLIPHLHKPHLLNPKQGFLSSANQHPTDDKYPYYLSESFWPSFRASRINDVLYKSDNITVDDMRNLQIDNTNMLAQTILPHMLNSISNITLSNNEIQIFHKIKNWNYKNFNQSIGATIFDLWYKKLEKNTWLDELGEKDEYTKWPSIDKLSELIEKNPNSLWFDNKETLIVENFSDISYKSFRQIVNDLFTQFDDLDSSLEWGNYQGSDILHLAKIPGLGKLNLYTSGGIYTVNAKSKHFGPSWRSIITMDQPKILKGIYPGGQSGYPGSKYYDNMIQDWVNGQLYDLQFSNIKDEISGYKIMISNGGKR